MCIKRQVRVEAERVRNALLSAVSHDLRTPLTAITGAASAALDGEARMDAPTRRELLESIRDEAERLNRFVGNLLDMTRLEAGTIEPKLDLVDIGEILGAALQRAGNILARHRVEIDIAADLPMVRLDAILFEQVLFNLLDNAAKYSPPGSRIDVHARGEGDIAIVEVIDEGPGIPPGDLERVTQLIAVAHEQRAGLDVRLRLPDVEPRDRVRRGAAGLSARLPPQLLPLFARLSRHAGAPGAGARARPRRPPGEALVRRADVPGRAAPAAAGRTTRSPPTAPRRSRICPMRPSWAP